MPFTMCRNIPSMGPSHTVTFDRPLGHFCLDSTGAKAYSFDFSHHVLVRLDVQTGAIKYLPTELLQLVPGRKFWHQMELIKVDEAEFVLVLAIDAETDRCFLVTFLIKMVEDERKNAEGQLVEAAVVVHERYMPEEWRHTSMPDQDRDVYLYKDEQGQMYSFMVWHEKTSLQHQMDRHEQEQQEFVNKTLFHLVQIDIDLKGGIEPVILFVNRSLSGIWQKPFVHSGQLFLLSNWPPRFSQMVRMSITNETVSIKLVSMSNAKWAIKLKRLECSVPVQFKDWIFFYVVNRTATGRSSQLVGVHWKSRRWRQLMVDLDEHNVEGRRRMAEMTVFNNNRLYLFGKCRNEDTCGQRRHMHRLDLPSEFIGDDNDEIEDIEEEEKKTVSESQSECLLQNCVDE